MSNEFDPKKIIDFSKNYYEILEIEKIDLPSGKSRDERVKTSQILENAFRKRARKCHPDFGGSNEDFIDIVRARRILEDPILKKIYDQGFFDEFTVENLESDFEVDWSKIGTYRKGTPEDTIGFSLFLKLCEQKEALNIVPAFYPTSNEHNYSEYSSSLVSDSSSSQFTGTALMQQQQQQQQQQFLNNSYSVNDQSFLGGGLEENKQKPANRSAKKPKPNARKAANLSGITKRIKIILFLLTNISVEP